MSGSEEQIEVSFVFY